MEQNYYLHYDNHAFDEYCKLEYPSVPKRNRFLRVVGIRGSEYFLEDCGVVLILLIPFVKVLILANFRLL